MVCQSEFKEDLKMNKFKIEILEYNPDQFAYTVIDSFDFELSADDEAGYRLHNQIMIKNMAKAYIQSNHGDPEFYTARIYMDQKFTDKIINWF